MNNEPIDVLYLWCDDADPEFKKSRLDRMKQLGYEVSDEENCGSMRFVSNDELKYSLRSVHQNIPWINHIWIVTNNQRPAWLKEHPKVTVVDHTECIPSHLLPSFNSVTIENWAFLNIKGLSEKFIYFNDDMFVNAPLTKDFFFDGDTPLVRMERQAFVAPYGNKHISTSEIKTLDHIKQLIEDPKTVSYTSTLLRAWHLICEKYGMQDFLISVHVCEPMTKSILAHVQSKYPQILEANAHAFRTGLEIQRLIYPLEAYYGLNMKLLIRDKRKLSPYQKLMRSLQRRTNFFPKKSFIECYCGSECDKVRKTIEHLHPLLFCLNAAPYSSKEEKLKSREMLERLFPIPSPYEK